MSKIKCNCLCHQPGSHLTHIKPCCVGGFIELPAEGGALFHPDKFKKTSESPSPNLNAGEGIGKVLRWVKASERLPTDAPAAQPPLAKEKVISLIELYKTHIPEEEYGWDDHVGDLDNIIFDIENNLQSGENPAPGEDEWTEATTPPQKEGYYNVITEANRFIISPYDMGDWEYNRETDEMRECVGMGTPDRVARYRRSTYQPFTPPEEDHKSAEEATKEQDNLKEGIEEARHDAAVFKEWWEKSEKACANQNDQLLQQTGALEAISLACQNMMDNPNVKHIYQLAQDGLKDLKAL